MARGLYALKTIANVFSKKLVIVSSLLLLILIEPIYSAYRTVLSFNIYALIYVLEINLSVEHIDNYGVISIHATSEGVYAYGFLILKDPDNEKPILYAYAGLQNETFYISELDENTFQARLVIPINEGGLLLVHGESIIELRTRRPRIGLNKIYLSVFNVTGREYDYPSIFIHSIKIYACNQSIDSIYEALVDLNNSIPCYGEVLVKNQAINIVEHRRGEPLKHIIYIIVGLMVSTIIVVLITYRFFRKRVERSVKTSYYQQTGASHPLNLFITNKCLESFLNIH